LSTSPLLSIFSTIGFISFPHAWNIEFEPGAVEDDLFVVRLRPNQKSSLVWDPLVLDDIDSEDLLGRGKLEPGEELIVLRHQQRLRPGTSQRQVLKGLVDLLERRLLLLDKTHLGVPSGCVDVIVDEICRNFWDFSFWNQSGHPNRFPDLEDELLCPTSLENLLDSSQQVSPVLRKVVLLPHQLELDLTVLSEPGSLHTASSALRSVRRSTTTWVKVLFLLSAYSLTHSVRSAGRRMFTRTRGSFSSASFLFLAAIPLLSRGCRT
jgi:hypothetical protein